MALRRRRLIPWWCAVAGVASGQTLHYTGEWRFLDAGRVQTHLSPTGASMELQTAGLADRLFQVRNSYAVTFNEALCAKRYC